jgi:hypothetical protein
MASLLDLWSKYSTLVGSLVALFGFLWTVYYNFWSSRRARKLENTYAVVKDLINLREPMEGVMALEGKPFSEWTSEDRKMAHTICLQFHIIGVLCMEGLVLNRVIGRTFYYSVPKCCQVLKPYIAELREKRDSRYFTEIVALNRMTLKIRKKFRGYSQETAYGDDLLRY